MSHAPLICAPLLALCVAHAAAQPAVLCHYDYGGQAQTLRATPVSSPYTVEAVDVGSFFHLRVVFEPTAVKIYTYGDRDDGPLLIHQASYSYPVKPGGAPDGFTGRQSVYEPVRDGELQYWCELAGARPARGRRHGS